MGARGFITRIKKMLCNNKLPGEQGGIVVITLDSHQCGPCLLLVDGSITGGVCE